MMASYKPFLTFLCLAFVLIMAVFITDADARQDRGKSEAFMRVMTFGAVRCGYVPIYPYIYKDSETGAVTGPMSNLMGNAVKTLNYRVDWIEEDAQGDIAASLNEGKYDAFCGVLPNVEGLADRMSVTKPILEIPYYIYVRVGDDRFQSLDDVNRPDVTVLEIKDDFSSLIREKHLPNASVLHIPGGSSLNDKLRLFESGRGDVLTYDPMMIFSYQRENPDTIERLNNLLLERIPIVYATGIYEDGLRDILDLNIYTLNVMDATDSILLEYDIPADILARQPNPMDRFLYDEDGNIRHNCDPSQLDRPVNGRTLREWIETGDPQVYLMPELQACFAGEEQGGFTDDEIRQLLGLGAE